MYKTIVRHKVRGVFTALTARNPKPFSATLAPGFEYRFAGDTALSGKRSATDMEQWWPRVFELFPDLTFEPQHIVVEGFPWDTTVATYVVVRGHSADGEPYSNEFMQIMKLAWGRTTRVTTIEDTQHLKDNLDRLAAKGLDAAAAPPVGQPAGRP
jgi:ketosteroid isomerase-like protein